MDSDCDYVPYSLKRVESPREYGDTCQLCLGGSFSEREWPEAYSTPEIPLKQALMGCMASYVDILRSERWRTTSSCTATASSMEGPEMQLCYVKRGEIVSLRGPVHLRDVPPNGTWLCHKQGCTKALLRLRLAGIICDLFPSLNRVVLEQKNDDGLLHLCNKWFTKNNNLTTRSVQLFGPFFCDVLLAPVLLQILRSDWIELRKARADTNNELKLGWAQEFYGWTRVATDKSGSMVFAKPHGCPCEDSHSHRIIACITADMERCGYTPWSAVQAVRRVDARLSQGTCGECRSQLLSSCAFLTECAAVEASRQRDWFVRNEAVIQLCCLLYRMHKPEDWSAYELLEPWTETILVHSVRFQEYKAHKSVCDVDTLSVMFGVDHLPFDIRPAAHEPAHEAHPEHPEPALLEAIARNDAFRAATTRYESPRQTPNELDANVSIALDVLADASEDVEARAQDVSVVAHALVSYFPRVAACALNDLTLKAPGENACFGRIWPIFVNPTRACYQLFRELALPASPSPVYTLELLARAWRKVTPPVLERFTPMSTGGSVRVSSEHYAKHLMGPVNTLFELGLVSGVEKDAVARVLSAGILPCFVSEGDSVPDRLVSSTLAMTFAACGTRVCGDDVSRDASTEAYRTVSFAGLLYFAAWYLLVYTGTVHAQPLLKKRLHRSGSEADRHLCAAFVVKAVSPGSSEYEVLNYEGTEVIRALRIVLGDLLDVCTILRVAELYVPELMAQLPYAKRCDLVPGSVKGSLEMRDEWFAREHTGGGGSRSEPGFTYLGSLAYGLHSSIQGTLTKANARPIARALCGADVDFDPWCGTLLFRGDGCDGGDLEDVIRGTIERDVCKAHGTDKVSGEIGRSEKESHSARAIARGIGVTDILRAEEDCDAGDGDDSRGKSEKSQDRKNPCVYDDVDEFYYDLNDSDDNNFWKDTSSTILDQNPVSTGRPSSATQRDEDTNTFGIEHVHHRDICIGLTVVNEAELGFNQATQRHFLREVHRYSPVGKTLRTFRPAVKHPSMRNIARTKYTKTRNTAHVDTHVTHFGTLIEALWVLFMHTQVSRVSSTGESGDVAEPSTPEALAVMIHLSAKSFQGITDHALGICNNIKSMYETACSRAVEFIPIAAVTGGLFGVNLDLTVDGDLYNIFNEDYGGLSAPGSLFCDRDRWYVQLDVCRAPITVPKERSTQDCHHTGTLHAYARLNRLRVSKVSSDNYCGFHTVAALLGIAASHDADTRSALTHKTAEYITTNKRVDVVKAYLTANNLNTREDIFGLLMQNQRWLGVDEVCFMLRAHGKNPAVVTDTTYPLVKKNHSHVLIKDHHYEPLVHM